MRTALLQMPSGIAGDMMLGALIDAGASVEAMTRAIHAVVGDRVSLAVEETQRAGVRGCRVEVRVDDEPLVEPGGPDSRGGLGSAGPIQLGAVAAPADHPPHAQGTHHTHHPHRAYADIDASLLEAALPPGVVRRARAVFRKLAEAEAGIHGTTPEAVHFHEVGSIDAVADIVGASAGLEDLGIDRLLHGPIAVGGGTVRAAHGTLPVPAPATAALLLGRACIHEEGAGELTTPTGAALLAALAIPAPDRLTVIASRIGLGAGRADPKERPNLLRLLLTEDAGAQPGSPEPSGSPLPGGPVGLRTRVAVLETSLDDCTPEEAGDALRRLFEDGALDVTLTPQVMKKSRPGFLLRVVSRPEDAERFARLLLEHTPTLGVRWRTEDRLELERREDPVQVEGVAVRVKVALAAGGDRPHVEHEDLVHLARTLGIPLAEARRRAESAWRNR